MLIGPVRFRQAKLGGNQSLFKVSSVRSLLEDRRLRMVYSPDALLLFPSSFLQMTGCHKWTNTSVHAADTQYETCMIFSLLFLHLLVFLCQITLSFSTIIDINLERTNPEHSGSLGTEPISSNITILKLLPIWNDA